MEKVPVKNCLSAKQFKTQNERGETLTFSNQVDGKIIITARKCGNLYQFELTDKQFSNLSINLLDRLTDGKEYRHGKAN